MDHLDEPALADVVAIVVPQREQVEARVSAAGDGWLDLTLLTAPRTSWAQLTRAQVAVQFSNGSGLCRLLGHLDHRPQDTRLRIVGYGSGETLRFAHAGVVQLLRRPAVAVASVSARIVVLAGEPPARVAVEARCVGVSGAGLRIVGLTGATVGQEREFDLSLIPQEPAVHGRFRVVAADRDGVVGVTLTQINPVDRRRLRDYAADHGARQVA